MVEFSTGSLFAGHRIEAVAGRGGMGIVYRATQLDLGRTLALKVIAPELAEDPRLRDRFVNESRVAASIDHPNVIPIFYAGEDQGVLFIAMRFVVGTDLRRLVRAEGRLALGRALHVFEQVADALDAAHVRGLIHRDVKPANVLLAAHDHAYLTDFGLTRTTASASGATGSGAFVGTLDYAAPEQIRGDRVDARGDVYALGCLLFYLLTSEVPYPRETDEAKLWAHLREPPPSATALVADLPTGLDAVIARAMSKQAEDRFPSAGDVARAAAAAAQDRPVEQPERGVAEGPAAPREGSTVSGQRPGIPAGSGAREVLPKRRDRRPAIALVLSGIVAVAVGLAIVLTDGEPPPPPPPPRPPPAGKVVARIPVGQRPNAIAATARDVWITSYRNDTVTRVSTSGNRVRDARLVIGIGGMDVAARYGSVWFVNSLRRELTRVSASSGRRRGPPLVLPLSPVTVDAGAGAVWVGAVTPPVNTAPSTIYRVDRQRMRVTDTIPVPGTIRSLATGPGAVWFIADGALYRLDLRTRSVRRVVAVGRESTVAVGAGAVWVASRRAGEVLQVEIPSERVITIPMRGAPSHIAIADDAVWVSNYGAHTVTRIDPHTSTVMRKPVKVGRNPLALAAGEHTIWATVVADNFVVRVDFR
jgi:streptogramin lyase